MNNFGVIAKQNLCILLGGGGGGGGVISMHFRPFLMVKVLGSKFFSLREGPFMKREHFL